MTRNKRRYPLSLDNDIVEKLDELKEKEYGLASRTVNQILRDHLDSYISGKPNQPLIDREEIRRILQEELSRIQIAKLVAGEEAGTKDQKEENTTRVAVVDFRA